MKTNGQMKTSGTISGYGLQTAAGQLVPVFFASKRKALQAAKARRNKQTVVPVVLLRGKAI
jgi:hypothetical protein